MHPYILEKGTALRLLIIIGLLMGIGLWVSVSIAGTEMGIADDILQFAVLFCALFMLICINMIGGAKMKNDIAKMQFTSKLGEYSQSTFAKGMLLALMLPFLPFFIALSALTRFFRRIGFTCAPHLKVGFRHQLL